MKKLFIVLALCITASSFAAIMPGAGLVNVICSSTVVIPNQPVAASFAVCPEGYEGIRIIYLRGKAHVECKRTVVIPNQPVGTAVAACPVGYGYEYEEPVQGIAVAA